MKNLLINLLRDEEGQGMVEYGIIIALISIVAIATVTKVGYKVNGAYTEANTKMTDYGIKEVVPAAGGTTGG